jgi:predicted nicotinamide N-methyase
MQQVFAELIAKRKPPAVPEADKQKEYHLPGLDLTIRIQEDPEGGVAGSIWEACYDLLNYVRSEFSPTELQDKRVLELGAGTGIASIVFAHLGAIVTATDRLEGLKLLELNVSINTQSVRHKVTVAEHNWGSDVSPFNPPLDFLIVSECIYNLRYGDELLASMRALSDSKTIILFAYAQRQPEEEAKFFAKVSQHFDIVEWGLLSYILNFWEAGTHR